MLSPYVATFATWRIEPHRVTLQDDLPEEETESAEVVIPTGDDY